MSSQPAPDETPIGERWGEFPPVERQAELKRMLEAWKSKPDHTNRPSPFEKVELTGADVYCIQALVAGAGDVSLGRYALIHSTAFIPLVSLHLEGANLRVAHLEGAHLRVAHLEGAHLQGTDLEGAHLQGAFMPWTNLQGAFMPRAKLQGALMSQANLQGANLQSVHLEGANLYGADLQGADLQGAHLTNRVDLGRAIFDFKTKLKDVDLDATIQVADVAWNGAPLILLPWEKVSCLGDEALAREARIEDGYHIGGRRKGSHQRLDEFEAAGRAYLQLAIALRSQGITEAADRFAYRAQILQRELLWLEIGLPMPGFKQRLAWLTDQSPLSLWQAHKQLHLSRTWKGPGQWIRQQAQRSWHGLHALRHLQWSPHLIQRPLWQWALAFIMVCTGIGVGVVHWWNALFAIFSLALLVLGLRQQRVRKLLSYLFSLFLAVLTGYGFRMSRIVLVYLLLICGFATAYWNVGITHPRDISFWTALIVSVTAFHGRVFTNPFAPNIPDAQVVITAIEAIVGLVIEGVFIAMLTQRFFNR